jgi:predicted MPP superfamily phosphohydrolase
MQLTDLHLNENENGITAEFVDELLDREKPDFVMVVGDIASGQKYNGSWTSTSWWSHVFSRV